MKTVGRKLRSVLLLALAALFMMCMTAAADELSGDNSLYSLGLENATCDQEFVYSTLEYTVTVPAGTEELYLSPVTSHADSSVQINGTVLENGSGTATITVTAPNGAQATYTLHVIPDVETPATETATEAETPSEEERKAEEARKQAESEEQARIQAEYKATQDKVNTMTAENNDLKDRIDLLLKVMYGLIGLAVLLLFFIINQSLRNKDLKDDLKDAKLQTDQNYDFARKDQNLQSDFYYAPTNGGMQSQMPQQNMGIGQSVPVTEATQSVQAAFGNVSQVVKSQPFPGQVNVPVYQQAGAAVQGNVQAAQQAGAPVQGNLQAAQQADVPVQENVQTVQQGNIPAQPEMQVQEEAPKLSRKEAKRLEKEAKKAASVEPEEPTVIQATVEEPDINVDMIDL